MSMDSDDKSFTIFFSVMIICGCIMLSVVAICESLEDRAEVPLRIEQEKTKQMELEAQKELREIDKNMLAELTNNIAQNTSQK